MKNFFILLCIFIVAFVVYFTVGTNYSFRPKWAIDYFNPMAKSLFQGHFYIENPAQTYDLIYYKEKWYMPWGILPSVFLIPSHIILGRFVPAFYLTIFFASLNVVLFYLLLLRLRREFFPALSRIFIFLTLSLFAFGTTQFYVGTLGSVWHVSQMVAAVFATAGILTIFKKKRILRDYFLSSIFFSFTLIVRPSTVFLLFLPLLLYFFSCYEKKRQLKIVFREIVIILLPFFLFLSWYFYYNYARFGNIFETGYSYIHEAGYLSAIRETNGISSIKNIPSNLWYMLFELPTFNFSLKGIQLHFNLNGNSIFFVSPSLLAIFFAKPIKKIGIKNHAHYYILSLWLTAIIGFLPILMHYSSGWMQFGYRYSLELTPILLLLSIFGLKGKLYKLYIVSIFCAIIIHIIGIHWLL